VYVLEIHLSLDECSLSDLLVHLLFQAKNSPLSGKKYLGQKTRVRTKVATHVKIEGPNSSILK
jgi:hypothetical protein